jgi:hypothetical protein
VTADDADALVEAMVRAAEAGLDETARSRRAARAGRCSVEAFATDLHRAATLARDAPA